jgi:hypothetical protein
MAPKDLTKPRSLLKSQITSSVDNGDVRAERAWNQFTSYAEIYQISWMFLGRLHHVTGGNRKSKGFLRDQDQNDFFRQP